VTIPEITHRIWNTAQWEEPEEAFQEIEELLQAELTTAWSQGYEAGAEATREEVSGAR
jgi:hypothetical protein